MFIASSKISGGYNVELHSIDVSLSFSLHFRSGVGKTGFMVVSLQAAALVGRRLEGGLDAVWTGAARSHPHRRNVCTPYLGKHKVKGSTCMRLPTKPTCTP